jgi:hypothetical protein
VSLICVVDEALNSNYCLVAYSKLRKSFLEETQTELGSFHLVLDEVQAKEGINSWLFESSSTHSFIYPWRNGRIVIR